MGRLTRDPEIRYKQDAEPMAIARYSLAVDKRFKREGEQKADFIPCVAFGKQGEFAERYFRKGQLVSVAGRLQVRNWEDNEGKKRVTTEEVVEEQYFAESKKDDQGTVKEKNKAPEGFRPIDEEDFSDLPF